MWQLGQGITGQGKAVKVDVTRFGLHRMLVEKAEQYPDLDIWLQALGPRAKLKTYYYVERETSGPVIYGLWLFWKED